MVMHWLNQKCGGGGGYCIWKSGSCNSCRSAIVKAAVVMVVVVVVVVVVVAVVVLVVVR